MSIGIKICGIRNMEALDAAVEAGADAVGFVFAQSPRRITAHEAEQFLYRLPPHVLAIAVVRDPTSEEQAALRDLPFHRIQLDADILPLPGWPPVLRAYADGVDLFERLDRHGFGSDKPFSGFLLDGARGGGLGEAPDLDRATRAAKLGKMVLAGGLTPENVVEKIRQICPAAVDVSSGVERERGIKDPVRIREFISRVREASR